MTKPFQTAKPDLILALDLPSREEATRLLSSLSGELRWVKIGLEMFCRLGPDWVKEVAEQGFSIFLDLKLHDIPNTVAGAVRSLRDLPIQMLTIHAGGGREMIAAAVEAARERKTPLDILAVTVLTSLSEDNFPEIGWQGDSKEQVLRLAKTATEAGAPGLVCSGKELSTLRQKLPSDIQLIVPGIRPGGSSPDEQKRVFTPADAVRGGASFLVVGRPILKSENPLETVRSLFTEMEHALSS